MTPTIREADAMELALIADPDISEAPSIVNGIPQAEQMFASTGICELHRGQTTTGSPSGSLRICGAFSPAAA